MQEIGDIVLMLVKSMVVVGILFGAVYFMAGGGV